MVNLSMGIKRAAFAAAFFWLLCLTWKLCASPATSAHTVLGGNFGPTVSGDAGEVFTATGAGGLQASHQVVLADGGISLPGTYHIYFGSSGQVMATLTGTTLTLGDITETNNVVLNGYASATLADRVGDQFYVTPTLAQVYINNSLANTWNATTETLALSLVGGYTPLTIANCNGTPVSLTAGQSATNLLNVVTCTTGTTSTEVMSANPPTAGRVLFFRNSASVTTITYGWSSGSTCTVLTGTSAILTADGTNCVKLMAGT